MAMTHRSLVPAVLLLAAIVVSTTTTIPTATAAAATTATDSLTKACNKTTYPASPSECVDVLLRFSPESATASPQRLAELSYQYLLKAGDALSRELDGAAAAAAKNKGADEGYRNCLDTLNANVKEYLRSVSRFSPEHGAGEFSKAKDNLREILSVPSNTGVSCPANAVRAEPAVNETYVYEDMLQVTLDLMSAAAATAPPEPEEAARRAKEEEDDDAAKEALRLQRVCKWLEDIARLARQIGRDPVVTACNESGAFEMLVSCTAALRSYPEREVVAATHRRRAEMMCAYLLKKGDEVAAELRRAAAEAKRKQSKSAACVQGYDDRMRREMATIAGLAPEKCCGEALSKFDEILNDDSTDPQDNCTVKNLIEIPVIARYDAFYELIFATGLVLNKCNSVQH